MRKVISNTLPSLPPKSPLVSFEKRERPRTGSFHLEKSHSQYLTAEVKDRLVIANNSKFGLTFQTSFNPVSPSGTVIEGPLMPTQGLVFTIDIFSKDALKEMNDASQTAILPYKKNATWTFFEGLHFEAQSFMKEHKGTIKNLFVALLTNKKEDFAKAIEKIETNSTIPTQLILQFLSVKVLNGPEEDKKFATYNLLTLSVRCFCHDIYEYMIDEKLITPKDITSERPVSPLQIAAWCGNTDFMHLAHINKCNLATYTVGMSSIEHYAAGAMTENCALLSLQYLKEVIGKNLHISKNRYQDTALINAMRKHYLDVMKYLLSETAGDSSSSSDSDGNTSDTPPKTPDFRYLVYEATTNFDPSIKKIHQQIDTLCECIIFLEKKFPNSLKLNLKDKPKNKDELIRHLESNDFNDHFKSNKVARDMFINAFAIKLGLPFMAGA